MLTAVVFLCAARGKEVSAALSSRIHEVDELGKVKLEPSTNFVLHLENVAFGLRADGTHFVKLYAPTAAAAMAMRALGHLPAYEKRTIPYRSAFWPAPVIEITDNALDATLECIGNRVRDEVASLYTPYLENMWHLHNDYLLPAIHNLRGSPACHPDTLVCKHPKVIYSLPISGLVAPAVLAAGVERIIFDEVRPAKQLFNNAHGGRGVCFRHFGWGRGPRFFYHGPVLSRQHPEEWPFGPPTDWQVHFQDARRCVRALNILLRRHYNLSMPRPARKGLATAVYIGRPGKSGRTLKSIAPLFAACENEPRVTCAQCCDWQRGTMKDVVLQVGDADVVMGPHGAGLAHILYARPGATLIDWGVTQVWHAQFELMAQSNGGGLLPASVDDSGSHGWTVSKSTAQSVFRNLTLATVKPNQ